MITRYQIYAFMRPRLRAGRVMTCFGIVISFLAACSEYKTSRKPFPIQDDVCDFFDTTQHMREYWIGISDSSGYPDVKVRIPSEYMDFRLKRITDVGRLDGAIGFDIRPLDFAPQSYGSIRAYPDGPIDPARPKYKRATGGLLLKQPMQIDATAQQWLTNASKGRKPLAEIIAAGRVSDIHPDLLVVENDGVFRGTHDIMLYISDGRIGNYFRCVKRELEESGRFAHASCSVYGNYGSLSYKHRFDRDFLPEWTAQVTKIETFIDCMMPEIEKED